MFHRRLSLTLVRSDKNMLRLDQDKFIPKLSQNIHIKSKIHYSYKTACYYITYKDFLIISRGKMCIYAMLSTILIHLDFT